MSAPDPNGPMSLSAGFDRQPPFSAEAEVSVLGGMLIDRDAVAKAIEVVRDSMFYPGGPPAAVPGHDPPLRAG